ncbi:MAG: nitroreductase family protein [Deltaproteobacteria bacterium]|nr:nitroreductase family protein [Deltaproteobacteria bacterium]
MNETLKTIHSLRSIHLGFSSQEIKDEDLKLILDSCIRAANAGNRQCYSIVVVEDRAVIKEICKIDGRKALLFCVDYTRLSDMAEHLEHQYSVDDDVWLSLFLSGSTDAILAAQTAAIAAKSLGIDSLFTSRIQAAYISRVYELLDLPEKFCFPLIMLLLGYPKEEPGYKKGRVSGPGIVHYGKYHRATSDELETLALQYDDPEKQMAVNPAWKDKSFKDWHYAGLENKIQKVALKNKN